MFLKKTPKLYEISSFLVLFIETVGISLSTWFPEPDPVPTLAHFHEQGVKDAAPHTPAHGSHPLALCILPV